MTGTLDLIAWPLTGGKVINERLDVDADAPVFSAEAFELAFKGFSIVNRHRLVGVDAVPQRIDGMNSTRLGVAPTLAEGLSRSGPGLVFLDTFAERVDEPEQQRPVTDRCLLDLCMELFCDVGVFRAHGNHSSVLNPL
jgi:hypothetical protein